MSNEVAFYELFEKPENWEGKAISIRGFIYKNPEGTPVLAESPNLKSCCLQKGSYLVLKGNLPQSSQPLLVEGILIKEAETGWGLASAKKVEVEGSYLMLFGAMSAVAVILGYLASKKLC